MWRIKSIRKIYLKEKINGKYYMGGKNVGHYYFQYTGIFKVFW